jgi:hypothetical protein
MHKAATDRLVFIVDCKEAYRGRGRLTRGSGQFRFHQQIQRGKGRNLEQRKVPKNTAQKTQSILEGKKKKRKEKKKKKKYSDVASSL